MFPAKKQVHNVTMIVSIQWRECVTFRCPFLFLFQCICSSAVPLADVCVHVSQFWGKVDFTEMIGIENENGNGNRNIERNDKLQRLHAYLISFNNELHP